MRKTMLAALAVALLPFLGQADDTSGNDFDRTMGIVSGNNGV